MKVYKIGSIVEMKKQHPCGYNNWKIIRLGIDVKIECTNCKRNIDKGVIPKLFYFEDDHDKNWFTESDIKYDYELKTPTIRKLEKDGVLHPRNLKNSEGFIYCSVFLLKENKEFFKTHQKVKKTYPETVVRGDNGEEIIL